MLCRACTWSSHTVDTYSSADGCFSVLRNAESLSCHIRARWPEFSAAQLPLLHTDRPNLRPARFVGHRHSNWRGFPDTQSHREGQVGRVVQRECGAQCRRWGRAIWGAVFGRPGVVAFWYGVRARSSWSDGRHRRDAAHRGSRVQPRGRKKWV